jgi:hypothetical protein
MDERDLIHPFPAALFECADVYTFLPTTVILGLIPSQEAKYLYLIQINNQLVYQHWKWLKLCTHIHIDTRMDG